MAFGDTPALAMSEEEFALLSELVHQFCGIRFREDMRYILQRRLEPRVRALGLSDFTAYRRYLLFDPSRKIELEAAVEALTTNETYFFREQHQLEAFSKEILPILARDRWRTRRLRIWSAGCSTGEEPYTVSMLLRDSRLFEGWDVEIFGSDISRRVLGRARTGIYPASALRSTPRAVIESNFIAVDDHFRVRDEVRAPVSFGHLNLLDGELLALISRFDVIFCRNVMIYFDAPARKRVLRSFYEKLWDGGFLLLGHSESLINVTADFEVVSLENDVVYRKPMAPVANP
jgi:chemotaxis protein methyltransferase CheR